MMNFKDFTHRIMLFSGIILILSFPEILVFFSLAKGLSFLIGGIVSIVNFKWLKEAADAGLYGVKDRKGGLILIKFFLRYGLILLVFYAILHTLYLDLLFAFLGFFVAVAAVLIECFYQIGKYLSKV